MKFGTVETPNNVFLAPMAGITDLPFRLICKEFGVGMMTTEMVSAKGLLYENGKTNDLLYIDPKEHPIGAQLFGSDPKILSEMAKQVEQSDVDFIDINMGCPAPKITKNGEGSALLKNPELIGEIVYAVAKALTKPLTVKIRKGFNDEMVNAVEVAKIIEEAGASAIALHGRTREQFYSGSADWDIIKEVKQHIHIPLIGNGDIRTPQDAKRMLDYTGCDAVLIARAAQGNPWIFKRTVHYLETGELLPEPTFEECVPVILKHAKLLEAYKGEYVGMREMRSHLTSYVRGVHGAADLRRTLTAIETYADIERLLEACLKRLESHE
ncbi:tRNA dihydrouridine synthase DusB [Cellulosilyticum lentocellum]|uniref:tRNA-dihydrouridine synthase n=1 Tax=Cellulosilyticum lentocellum (strain ATCC 49066 / DSM 5427 / NCIMB 11756 / RHM5) TaxID=642492 RepID=F2JR85_CELLD|nr:tRNA dihydrouridine synthase DusB [Cellulosilyticum lentocellum]ADZ85066.1 TIM-barrel protein, nifR3 family [Cellulosilyticum lentocellum DSM 5427]